MPFARVFGAQPTVMGAHMVAVEADLSRGLHSFTVVGLPDKAIEEARDRMSAAIKNSGLLSPKEKNQKVIIALAPAELKKEGAFFDLPMTLCYLLATKEIRFDPSGKLFAGELALDGTLRPVRGALSLAQAAKTLGLRELYIPKDNANEAALVDGIAVYPVSSLKELLKHLSGETPILPHERIESASPSSLEALTDFFDIKGQESAKRGLLIAASGGHNILLWGPPGTGKTMLARALAGILPPLTREEALEATAIHSYAGSARGSVIAHPPFRSPHHTASYVSIIGGGSVPKPGEITLAHRGVLFLDEFPEFDKRVIESLRQPIEEGVVHVSRAKGTERFPSRFVLIAAMNPCPCGYFGDREKPCTCSPGSREKYRRKISGPIMDRIDLWIEVPRIPHELLSRRGGDGAKSAEIMEKVKEARRRQHERYTQLKFGFHTNNDITPRILSNMTLSDDVKKTLEEAARTLGLSPRAYHRVLRVARTIADLDGADYLSKSHILEALSYRPRVDLTL